MTEVPAAGAAPPAQDHGRAGRNLPAAIGIGVGLGAYVVLSLIFCKPALRRSSSRSRCALGSIELHHALQRTA